MQKKIYTVGHFELPVNRDTSTTLIPMQNSNTRIYVVDTKVFNSQSDYTVTNNRLRGNSLSSKGTAGTK